MELSIKNRLNFQTLLPRSGNILEQILIKGITDRVNLTHEEAEQIELKSEGQTLRWNPDKAFEKEIEFSEAEINLLKEQVKRLDQEKAVNQDNLELCLIIQNI